MKKEMLLSTIRKRLKKHFHSPYNYYEIRKRLFKNEYEFILSKGFYANTGWASLQKALLDHEVSMILTEENNND